MPWLPSQNIYQRKDPDFTGPTVWQDNLQAGYKIIASRHDDHDQDIANGISACLNIDGYNSMRADIKMGGFRITGLATGTAAGDVALVGQTVNDMTFNAGTRELTLTKTGQDDLVAIIPASEGGGTVSEINLGPGLTGASNPLTTTGDIQLATVKPGYTVTDGIGSISVDQYGRVTNVTQGAPNQTNLSIGTVTTNNVTVVSSTGTNAVLTPATSTLAGLMRAADKGKLDAIPNFGGAGLYKSGTSAITATGVSVNTASVVDWVRIGNLVHFAGYFQWNSRTAGTTELELVCAGLPGNAKGQPGSFPYITGNYRANEDVNGVQYESDGTLAIPAFTHGVYVEENSKTIKFGAFYGRNTVPDTPPVGAGDVVNANLNSLAASGDFNFSGWYFTDL